MTGRDVRRQRRAPQIFPKDFTPRVADLEPARDLSAEAPQTLPPRLQGLEGDANGAVRAGGFSLHAGVDIASNQREKLERLCCYVSRPPVASERLALTASGHVRYTLKTPYRDGTTHIVL